MQILSLHGAYILSVRANIYTVSTVCLSPLYVLTYTTLAVLCIQWCHYPCEQIQKLMHREAKTLAQGPVHVGLSKD